MILNNISIKLFFYLLVLLMSVLCGCTDDNALKPEDQRVGEVSFSVRIPAAEMPSTRSMDGAKEYEINEISVLIFDVDESNNENYAYSRLITNLTFTSTNPYTVEFRVKLSPDRNYNLLMVANPDASLKTNINNIVAGETKNNVLKQLQCSYTGKWPVDEDDYMAIPMFCETGKISVTNEDDRLSGYTFVRMLARIDVLINLADNSTNTFLLENVYVCNYNTIGYVAPSSYLPNIPTASGTQVGVEYALAYSVEGATHTTAALRGQIYAFEAPEAPASDKGFNGYFEAVCLVLEGSFNGEENSFYRVDFKYEDQSSWQVFMPLIRNNLYQIEVVKVSGPGCNTLEEAIFTEGVEINVWTKTLVYDLGQITDVVFNNWYMLGTNAKRGVVEFDPDGETGYGFTIHTDFEYGYTVESYYDVQTGEIPDWLTFEPQHGTGTQQFTFDVETNDQIPRQACLVLSAGRLRDTILFHQHMAPNCYILTPGQSVSIPVSKAYRIWKEYTGIATPVDLSGVTPTAKLYWKDVKGNIIENQHGLTVTGSGKDAHIHVKAGTVTGNAIVAMYDDSGIIRWSWHIWVVDEADPPRPKGGSGPKNLAWMDRNLGARENGSSMPEDEVSLFKTFGFLYQGGRKDPFPAAGKIGSNYNTSTGRDLWDASDDIFYAANIYCSPLKVVTAIKNLENTIMDPFAFYNNTTSYADWYTSGSSVSNRNNYLWYAQNGLKGLFDPCPAGYRVPVKVNNKSPWLGADYTSWYRYGSVSDIHGGYYPANGIFWGTAHYYYAPGQSGRYWIASDNSQYMYLNFAIWSLDTNTTDRGNAYAVRCQREV